MNCFWKIPLPCFRTIALAHLLARDLPKHFYVIILANFHLFWVIIFKLSLIITFMTYDILLWKQLMTKYWWQKPPSFLRQFTFAKVSLKFIFESMINLLISFVKFNFLFAIWYMWCYQKNLFYQEQLYVIGICGKIVLDYFSSFANWCRWVTNCDNVMSLTIFGYWWRKINGDSDVGDIIMLVTLWWRLIWDVEIKLVINKFGLQYTSPTSMLPISSCVIIFRQDFTSNIDLAQWDIFALKEFLNDFSAGSLGIVEIEINWFKPVLNITPKNGHSKLIFTAERRISICFRNFRNQFENRFEPVL